MVAVSGMAVPAATVPLTVTVNVKLAVVPDAMLAMEQVYGEVLVQVQPAGPDSDENVVLAGSVSVRTTVVALAGPAFLTVCEKVTVCPALTGFGLPELVTLMSACVPEATPMVTVAVLLALLESCVVVATVAVSVMIVPAAVPAGTVTTSGNVLVEFGATLGFEQLMDPVVVQVQPAGTGVSETNVVLFGNGSVNVAPAQLLGPELVTTCV